MQEVILSTNANSWDLGYHHTLTAEPIQNIGRGLYVPIPPYTIPTLFDHHILAVSTYVEDADPRWRMGCKLRQLLEANYLPVQNPQGYELTIPPSRGILVTLPRITAQYRLQVWVPWWIREITVNIWQYLEDDSRRVEALLNQQAEVIRVDLARIESKVDVLVPNS